MPGGFAQEAQLSAQLSSAKRAKEAAESRMSALTEEAEKWKSAYRQQLNDDTLVAMNPEQFWEWLSKARELRSRIEELSRWTSVVRLLLNSARR